jgi:hypothetical protein
MEFNPIALIVAYNTTLRLSCYSEQWPGPMYPLL